MHHSPLRVVAGRAKALVRTRVEPKTFFANERTFLQWLQIRWGCGLAAYGGVVDALPDEHAVALVGCIIAPRAAGFFDGTLAFLHLQCAHINDSSLCFVTQPFSTSPSAHSVLILMTATSMLSGTGLLSGLTGSGSGGAAGSCDTTDKACFASKVGCLVGRQSGCSGWRGCTCQHARLVAPPPT